MKAYGVNVPESCDGATCLRLDGAHGRNARRKEVSFLEQEWGKPSSLSNRIELHIYGRTNNACRWAGCGGTGGRRLQASANICGRLAAQERTGTGRAAGRNPHNRG